MCSASPLGVHLSVLPRSTQCQRTQHHSPLRSARWHRSWHPRSALSRCRSLVVSAHPRATPTGAARGGSRFAAWPSAGAAAAAPPEDNALAAAPSSSASLVGAHSHSWWARIEAPPLAAAARRAVVPTAAAAARGGTAVCRRPTAGAFAVQGTARRARPRTRRRCCSSCNRTDSSSGMLAEGARFAADPPLGAVITAPLVEPRS